VYTPERVGSRAGGGQKVCDRDTSCTFLGAPAGLLPGELDRDAAVCFWGSFGYFDAAGDLAFATGLRRALRPGGALLLDNQVMETWWTFQLGGRERSARSSQRIYTCRELREVLQSAGFGTFTHLAAGTDREFRVGDPRMWLVARA
jgi:hypothetical protein